jgi:hypothetical protein
MRKGVRISAERPRLERELDQLEAGGLAVIAVDNIRFVPELRISSSSA